MTANPQATDKQGYHQFTAAAAEAVVRYTEDKPYGSFEVFWSDGYSDEASDKGVNAPGWYWWACFPGCMPDGDAVGPFNTSQEAYDDAQEGA